MPCIYQFGSHAMVNGAKGAICELLKQKAIKSHWQGLSPTFMGISLKAGLAAAVLVHGLVSVAATTKAARLGDMDAGLKFATESCAQCHDITSRNPMNTASGAPTFYVIANASGVSRTSLFFWMQSSHPKMPGLMIEPQDLDNVIAYILSLKDK